MKIDVLGAEYTLTVIRGSKEPRLKDCDGFCDETTKEMLVENYEDSKGEPNCKQNLLVQTNKVKRHEIIHAFLFESGLAENSSWAQNEEMVDFFAIQFPKLLKGNCQPPFWGLSRTDRAISGHMKTCFPCARHGLRLISRRRIGRINN